MKAGESKIFKHGVANTLYVAIPAKVATDSACDFKEGDSVDVRLIEGGGNAIIQISKVKDIEVVKKK